MSAKPENKKMSKDQILIFFLQNRAFLLVLIFVLLLSLFTSTFLTKGNLISLARQISANGIIGVGYTFLLASNSVDLSAGYMMCMIGIISGLLSQTTVSFPIILLICCIVGIICSSWNATIENKFNLPPFLVTLAMQQIFRGTLMLLSNGSPIPNLDEGIIYMGQGYIGPIPFSVMLMLVFIIIGHIIFSRTQFGRNVIAVGGNPEAARVSGINVEKTRVQVAALLGFTIAIMALVSCGRVATAQTNLGGETVMDIIAAVVIGGTPMGGGSGTVVGTLFGCLVIGLISNGLNLLKVSSYWQMVSKGVIILVAVIVDVFSERIYDRMRNKE
ncbi:MAG: ABC transporter permease [Erysipelotrichaceae bacterium]|nr:ABC transporter permease [Erysipelotrichaceae bacterium]